MVFRSSFNRPIHAIFTMAIGVLTFAACESAPNESAPYTLATGPVIAIETNYGEIMIQLYDETPKHRDNMLQLINERRYDSVLFHRVIREFVIQAGDPNSRTATSTDTLGSGDLEYTVPAEIDTVLFHRRGVIGAARDNNPERASSAMQFYIVQGKIVNDSLLGIAETRINDWLAQYYAKKAPENEIWMDSLKLATDTEDWPLFQRINDTLVAIAKNYTNFERYSIPESHKEVYKTLGGIPHLDQNYTVFGEVIEGMHVVDSIAAVETTAIDRPVTDVRIKTMRLVKE